MRALATQHFQFIIIGGETGCGGQAVFAPAIGVGQQVVALHFGFGLFGLSHSGLAVAEGYDVAFHTAVEYGNDRRVGAAAVGGVVHGVHHLELEVLQEVPLGVHVTRSAIVFRTCCIGFQFHINHGVIHLCLLKAG